MKYSFMRVAVMSKFRIKFYFSLLVTLYFAAGIVNDQVHMKSLQHNIEQTSFCCLAIRFPVRSYPQSRTAICNLTFTMSCISAICVINFSMWLCVLLLNISGDIHPNPGPSTSTSSSFASSVDMSGILRSPNSLSLVHYNVQSLLPKLDLLVAEFSSFDILTFSETWLSDSVTNDQISIPGYSKPIRRDRPYNSYDTWLVKFNPLKSESLVISRKRNKPLHIPILMHNTPIPFVESHKHLGVLLSNDGSWHLQLESIKSKAWSRVNNMKRLRYLLDRKSLEIIYISFIRPVIEYSDVIWDNCTAYEKQDLEKIQHEAARIVSGCTRLVSIRLLYNEVGWESLETRRCKHKLILFFKMVRGMCPNYLSELVPQSVGVRSSRVLRNSSNLDGIRTRTSLYGNSFLPSTINTWNSLPEEAKCIDSVANFKSYLNRDKSHTNPLFYYGKRKLQVLHSRLRTDCSSLNKHLYDRNLVASPHCQCGLVENTYHYFFVCTRFHNQRLDLFNAVSALTEVSLRTLLYGDDNIPIDDNFAIFDAVHLFIGSSKRFDLV